MKNLITRMRTLMRDDSGQDLLGIRVARGAHRAGCRRRRDATPA